MWTLRVVNMKNNKDEATFASENIRDMLAIVFELKDKAIVPYRAYLKYGKEN